MSERKLILYISMSLDGFIATNDDDLSWLEPLQETGETYGYNEFTADVDTYLVGRKTYDVVMGLTAGVFSQADLYNCYVITRQNRDPENGVTFYNGDLEELITQLKSENGKNIYCDGGGEIVKLLMDKNLIDEYIISVVPMILGDGKRLFKGGIESIKLEALESKQYKSGLVQLKYAKA